MGDKCIVSILCEGISRHKTEFSTLPPLPDIILKAAYLREIDEGIPPEVILLYEFEKLEFAHAIKKIATQLNVFRNLPGFTCSAHLMEESAETKSFWGQLLDECHLITGNAH
jgi:hypothetical protein